MNFEESKICCVGNGKGLMCQKERECNDTAKSRKQ